MVAYVTVITKNQFVLIIGLAANFADCAIQTTPTLLSNSSTHAFQIATVAVIRLATLGTRNQRTCVQTEGTTRDAYILLQGKSIIFPGDYHSGWMIIFLVISPGLVLKSEV